MIDKKHGLPMNRQAKLLDMSRSSVYYPPRPASESDLRLMRQIDELHLEHPFAGTHMLRDQSSQFTSSAFIGVLEQNGIQISMDGKGCWRDNVFVERLWKSVKYEEVYLHGYETVSVARQALTRYFDFYNRRRPHSTLDGNTPDTAYFNFSKPPLAAAA